MSGERHWADIGEAGFVGGMRLLLWIHRWFGRLPFRIALMPVLGYFFIVRGSARRASLEYLERLQHIHAPFSRKPGWAIGWRHFLSFADALLDKVLAMGGGFTLDQISMRGQDLVLPLLEAGRGAVMLTAHVGNLEVCQALAELQPKLRLNILVHRGNAEKFNRLLERQGASQVRLMEVTDITPATAMELADRVAAGEMLVIAADRLTPGSARRSVAVPFLGAPAHFPQGPFILASLLRCPVFLVFCTQRGGRYHIDFERFAERIERVRGAADSGLTPWIARFAERVEQQCAQAPLQWFNFYPFWAA